MLRPHNDDTAGENWFALCDDTSPNRMDGKSEMSAGSLLLVLDFLGVFAFALNGALTAIGTARLDNVGSSPWP